MKAVPKELRKAAPLMLAFLQSINHKTELSSADQSEIAELIQMATTSQEASVIPLIKNTQQAAWNVFIRFYVHEFDEEYISVNSKLDARKFKEIADFLDKKAESAGMRHSDPSTRDKISTGFWKMLEYAAKDNYLRRLFRPAIIAQNMPNIYTALKTKQQLITAPSLQDRIAAHY